MGRKGKRGILILLAAVCLTLSAWMLWPRALELSGEGNYSILVIRTAVEAGRPDSETVTLDIQVRSPEGAALLEQLQGLSFRRSLTDPLIKPLAEAVNASHGSVSYEVGDWVFSLSLTGTDGDFAVLNFTVREWSYAPPGQMELYSCSVPDGEAVGRALGEQLWALAAEHDPNS